MNAELEAIRQTLLPYQALKGAFPFRLGTTSYIYPGEILPNAELLADFFDEIQLLLFESQSISNIPDESTIARLNRIGSEKKLRYSIHLPLDTYPGHEDEEVRRQSVQIIERLYKIGRALRCERFVFHYSSRNPEGKPFGDLTGWRNQLCKSTEELLASGVNPQHLCVENLAYPYSWVADLVERYGLSKCIDIGHLRVNSFPVNAHLKRHLARTKVIHLHGLNKGVDHCGLSKSDGRSIRQLFAKVYEFAYRETIILEVFQLDHLVQSLQTFAHYWNKDFTVENT